METFAKLRFSHQPLHLSLNPHRPSFTNPISSLSLTTPPPSPLKLSCSRATLSQTHKPSPLQSLTPILRTASIALTAAAAVFFAKFSVKPAIASPVAAPESVESDTAKESVSLSEQERALEEQLSQNPTDIEALRLLMEVRIKSRKLTEAVEVVDRLIELEPSDEEWPLLKAQLYSYSGDHETASKLFEEILEKDPLRVEAYHGLVMASSEAGESMNGLLKRIESAMEKCKKEKRKSDVRDFKLLLAQVRVMEEKYSDALKAYEELVKEEPRDFRPYLCQGIIYTLLRKKDEAEKKFEQFRKLVPKNHPYREYFLDNMFASKFFSEKLERDKA